MSEFRAATIPGRDARWIMADERHMKKKKKKKRAASGRASAGSRKQSLPECGVFLCAV